MKSSSVLRFTVVIRNEAYIAVGMGGIWSPTIHREIPPRCGAEGVENGFQSLGKSRDRP